MKYVKKVFALLLCACMLTACSGKETQIPVKESQPASQSTAIESESQAPAESESQVPAESTEKGEVGSTVPESTDESTKIEEDKAQDAEVKEEEETMPEKLVALTFDDGPNTTIMVEILDILKEEDVKATFYLIGNNINFTTEDVVKRAFEEGHELGNHSQSHDFMDKMDAETLKQEIELVQKKVENLVGVRPATFRPPYIAINQLMHDTIDLPFIVGVDSKDWDPNATGQDRYNNVISGAQDGAIFLLHCFPGNTETVKVLPAIIKELREQGYGFVTVSELFEIQGVTYEPHDGQRFSVLEKQN